MEPTSQKPGVIITRLGAGTPSTGFSEIESYTAYPSDSLSQVLQAYSTLGFITIHSSDTQIVLHKEGVMAELRFMTFGVHITGDSPYAR
jgi:hypothetical protein